MKQNDKNTQSLKTLTLNLKPINLKLVGSNKLMKSRSGYNLRKQKAYDFI